MNYNDNMVGTIKKKRQTPFVLKLSITIFFVLVPVFTVALKAYEVEGVTYLYSIIGGYQTALFALIAGAFAIPASIAGIVLIWVNRPQYSAIFVGVIIAFMMIPTIGIITQITRVTIDGFIAWGALLVLIILVILAIFLTKEISVKSLPKPVPAASAAVGFSAADEIKKFKDLMDAGVITPEEFERKKQQLLRL